MAGHATTVSYLIRLSEKFLYVFLTSFSKTLIFLTGVKHTTWTDPRGVTHNYFFSWEHAATRSLEVDWLDARNICRRHCMDTVSLETPAENEFIKSRIASANVKYIWTSGRKCNFKGCSERPDQHPNLINGWFWSGSGVKLGPTNNRNNGDWSEIIFEKKIN